MNNDEGVVNPIRFALGDPGAKDVLTVQAWVERAQRSIDRAEEAGASETDVLGGFGEASCAYLFDSRLRRAKRSAMYVEAGAPDGSEWAVISSLVSARALNWLRLSIVLAPET